MTNIAHPFLLKLGEVMFVDARKNIGLIMLLLGVLLTLDHTSEFNGIISQLINNIKQYWPLLLCLLGLYFLCTPTIKK